MNNNVNVNSFLKRQTQSSGKSYSRLSFESIAKYAEKKLNDKKFKTGYRDGVILIDVDDYLISQFMCPYTEINDDTKLKAKIVRRRINEEYYIQIRALNGTPLETGRVEIILYRHDVLAETNEHESSDGWELIAFNAIPAGIKHMPIGPITMMRNQLQLTGGTKGKYTSDQWAESVNFWQKYAVLESRNNN